MDRKPQAPGYVRWITKTLEDAGFETWAVGGAVRNALLGLSAGDWDMATRAPPEVVQRLFPRTVPVGIEHGTVGVLTRDRVLVEVTIESTMTDIEVTELYANGYMAKLQNTTGIKSSVDDSREGFMWPKLR